MFDIKECESEMKATINAFSNDLKNIRTGRVSPEILKSIIIDSYGSKMPLTQLSNINNLDNMTLSINIWDASLTKIIEKNILESNLGASLWTNGIPSLHKFTALTAARRKDPVKIISETSEKFNEINKNIENLEPELVNKIIEKEKNKTESEKLQDKFDQMSKLMDMQNMRMLQMYHSTELQHSHSILQKNMEKNSTKTENKNKPEIFSEELKKEVFPQIQKEMDKQFNLLKEQLSEYEIKSVLDKIGSTDLNREFKKPTKKFTNLFDAKKYVKNSISKKSRDWIKNNDLAIDEIAKKLLDK